MIYHNINPIFDKNTKILILGSFPSVKSRQLKFYYGHPQNRFWKMMKTILEYKNEIDTIDDKIKMLLKNNIGLWDVIKSCEITGSSDSSIKNIIPNDIYQILNTAKIEKVVCNGKTAFSLYKKYIGTNSIYLPSTSPANAKYSLEDLINIWQKNIL